MPRAWIDRTGQTYGPYLVLSPGPTRGGWNVACTRCGEEYIRTTATLQGMANKGSTRCAACWNDELKARQPVEKKKQEYVSPWAPDPLGLVQQEWITRGFVAR